MNFEPFNLHPSIMSGVRELGYTEPTPIQREAIPHILQGRDIIGLAQTGTGKTAAFTLPILQRLVSRMRGRPGALILSPTRELAEQTCESLTKLGKRTGLRSVTVYGGVSMEQQVRALRQGAEIVVACPGRLLDHIWKGSIDLAAIEVLVIDEADRMFDMGFLPDVRNIIKCVLKRKQTLLFSATMPNDIRRLVQEVLHNPVTVQIGRTAPATTVSHKLYPVMTHLKSALLIRLLRNLETDSVLIFTRTKHRTEHLAKQLDKAGYDVTSLQGNLSQNRRKAAMDGFRTGNFKILVATDVAARGIDVQHISHVINYDMPDTVDAYIHRIGRTGRVDQKGEAFSFITEDDKGIVHSLEEILHTKLERRVLEGFDYSLPGREKAQPASKRMMAVSPRVRRLQRAGA